MAVLKSPVQDLHFYSRDGKAVHSVPLGDSDAGGTRPTNMSDARKLGLIPSVSGYLSVLDRPGLTKWRHKKIAEKVVSIKRKPKENDEDLIDRILDEAFQVVRDAADAGSLIHAEIERFFTHDWSVPFQPNEKVAVNVGPVVAWMQSKGIKVENPEKVVVNLLHGYAGTTDCPFRWKNGQGIGVIDFKSKNTKPGEAFESYPEQSMQIAAYAAAYWGEQNLSRCWGANVFISRNEPGRVDLVMYKPEMLVADFEAFKHICAIYRHLKQWDPRVGPNDPKPVFYNGVWSQISLPGGQLVKPATPATHPPPPPPASADPVKKFPETGPTMLDLIMGATKFEHVADGMEFLDPKTCAASFADGRVKTSYAWYFHEETKVAKVGLIGDAALAAHGWRDCFRAYPKHLDHLDRAAGKPDPVVGTNNLPVKPAPTKVADGPKISKDDLKAAVKEEKQKSAERLKQLERMPVGFGRYKDKTLGEVDSEYLDWARGQPQLLKSHRHLAEYLSRDDVNRSIDRDLKRKER